MGGHLAPAFGADVPPTPVGQSGSGAGIAANRDGTGIASRRAATSGRFGRFTWSVKCGPEQPPRNSRPGTAAPEQPPRNSRPGTAAPEQPPRNSQGGPARADQLGRLGGDTCAESDVLAEVISRSIRVRSASSACWSRRNCADARWAAAGVLADTMVATSV